jgi:hypothetical protein
MTGDLLIDHVLLHVRDALATDARVGELGLDVSCDGDVVVVRGAVSTPRRQEGIVTVATEVLRELGCSLPVRDETSIPDGAPPETEPERL